MPKLCIHCGIDCADAKRFKDAHGRYTCLKCHDRLKYGLPIEKHTQVDQGASIALAPETSTGGDPSDCPRCKAVIPAGETVCRECRYDTSIIAAPRLPEMEVSRLCPKCGYDLKGLSEKQACPECGADVYEREHVKRVKKADTIENFYKQPLIIGACGLGALALIRLINGDMQRLVIDCMAIGVSVPFALLAYWLFSMIWAGGFDQGWMLASANFFAVFAISWTVDTFFHYVPIPFIGWVISLAVYYGMLKERLDLDAWLDALVLTIILRLIQLGTLFVLVSLL